VKQELRPGQGPPYFKLTAAGYYLSCPSPAGELSESLEKETECGRWPRVPELADRTGRVRSACRAYMLWRDLRSKRCSNIPP
jgi:hypothetical protein